MYNSQRFIYNYASLSLCKESNVNRKQANKNKQRNKNVQFVTYLQLNTLIITQGNHCKRKTKPRNNEWGVNETTINLAHKQNQQQLKQRKQEQ